MSSGVKVLRFCVGHLYWDASGLDGPLTPGFWSSGLMHWQTPARSMSNGCRDLIQMQPVYSSKLGVFPPIIGTGFVSTICLVFAKNEFLQFCKNHCPPILRYLSNYKLDGEGVAGTHCALYWLWTIFHHTAYGVQYPARTCGDCSETVCTVILIWKWSWKWTTKISRSCCWHI